MLLGNNCLVTLYGPNADVPAFFEEVHSKIDNHQVGDLIVGGGFNFGMDCSLDRKASGRTVSNNERYKRAVENIMNEYNLTDVWRVQNPFKREYTFIRSNSRSMSRIDFFLASEALLYGNGETTAQIVDMGAKWPLQSTRPKTPIIIIIIIKYTFSRLCLANVP